MLKAKYSLFLILLIGICLRLVWLDKYPSGFTPDEAALGYNAYSLLLTGRDEWAAPFWHLPLTNLKSFGDYKPPLYSFLAVPAIKFFGLTEFAVRLPSAIFGSLSVLSVYLLAVRLFSRRTAVWAAFMMAVSPWSVMLSRGAFEANLITFFLPLIIYAWASRRYMAAISLLAINFYSYHSARFLTFPVVILLAFFFRDFRKYFYYLLLLFLLTLPGLLSFLGPGRARVADVGIFNPTDDWYAVSTRRFDARNAGLPDSLARLFSNKLTYTVSAFVENYFTYFSPQFLFTTGPAEASHGMIPGRGVLYYVELPLLLAFAVQVIIRPRRSLYLLLLLLFLAPVPAALAKGTGFAGNRSAAMIPILMLMSSSGLVYLLDIFTKFKSFIKVALLTGYCLLLAFVLEDYIYHAPVNHARDMHYGWRELMVRLIPIADRFSEVRVSRSLSEPHIFFAFYLPIPPREYQASTRSWPNLPELGLTFLDQYDGYYLGKYRFGDTHSADPVVTPTLYVIPPGNFPDNYPEYFHIDYPSGKPAIIVAEKLP